MGGFKRPSAADMWGLMDPAFFEFRVAEYDELQWTADRSSGAVMPHPEVLAWEKAMVLRCRELAVPVYCQEMLRSDERHRSLSSAGDIGIVRRYTPRLDPFVQGYACQIQHCVLQQAITPMQDEVLRQIGLEVSSRTGTHMAPLECFHLGMWVHREWQGIENDLLQTEMSG